MEQNLIAQVYTGNTQVPGLWYEDNFITEAEEQFLMAECNKGDWSNELKRRVQHYGYKYSYTSKNINKNDKIGELPTWCDIILQRLKLRGLSGFDQMIANEYNPGQGINGKYRIIFYILKQLYLHFI